MNNDDLLKLLPIAGTIISIASALALNKVEERKEKLRRAAAATDAQLFVTNFAAGAQTRIDALTRRIDQLETEGREKDARIANQEQHIYKLESRINELTGIDEIEEKIDLALDAG